MTKPIRVRAFGSVFHFPADAQSHEIEGFLNDNEPKLNPDYKPPASSNIKNIAKEYLGVDVDQLSKKMSDSRKSIADRAEESATRGENAAAPQVPGAPVRQSTYNSALLNDRFGIKPQDNLDQSGILGRIGKTADEDIRGQVLQENLRGAITDAPPPVPSGLTGLAKNVLTGTKQTGRMIGASVDVARNDLLGVEDYAKESGIAAELNTPIEQRKLNEQFKQIDRDQGLLGKIGDTVSAARQNPMGMGQLIAEQLPNTGVLIGGSYAGFKTGALAGAVFGPVGATIGGALGLVGGMFLGNTLVEAGGKAIEKASDEDGFTPQEREDTINEGLKKSAVLTGVDLATLKIGGMLARSIGRPAINAGARAETKVLIDSGVDATSLTAINAALRSSPELFKKARMAGEVAAIQSLSTGRKAGILGSVATLETLGEGIGEYAGEQYATGKGDVVDATVEALSSATMSLAETAYNYHKVASGNDLSAKGIQKAASNINDHETKTGIDAIRKSQSVDEAIQAANEAASRKTVTKDDVLRTIDPTLADIERLTGLKPSESIEQAINQAQQGLSPESIPAQGQQANVAPNADIAAPPKPVSQNDINEYAQLINDAEARKNNSPDTWTSTDEKMLSLAKEKLSSITQPKGDIHEEETSQAPSSKKSAGVLGDNSLFDANKSSSLNSSPNSIITNAQFGSDVKSAHAGKPESNNLINTNAAGSSLGSGGSDFSESGNNGTDANIKGSGNLDIGETGISKVDNTVGTNTVGMHSLGGEAAITKESANRGTPDTKALADLVSTQTFIEKGFDGLNSEDRGVMVSAVVGSVKDHKIFDSVVTSLPVNVVNVLRAFKLTPEMVLHNPSVLGNLNSVVNSDKSVPSIDASGAIIKSAANTIAKISDVSGELRGGAVDRSSAVGTIDNRHGITPNSSVVAGVSDVEASDVPTIIAKEVTDKQAAKTKASDVESSKEAQPGIGLKGGEPSGDWRQLITNMISKDVFRDIVSQSIQNDGQKVLDAALHGNIPALRNLLVKYTIDAGKNQGGGGAGPGKVPKSRRGGEAVFNAALISIQNIENQQDSELKFSRSPEERIKDRERSKQLESKLKEQGYDFTIKAKDVRDFAAMDRGRQNEAVAAEQIAKNFGKRIVWIEAIGDYVINGVMDRGIKDTIFIDVNTDKYARAVMGHELSHHMERDNPALYRDLVDSLENLIKNHDEYADEYDIRGEDKSFITKEIVGDIMGDNFTDQEFWNKVAEYNPSAFREIADKIISWLKNLVIKARSRGLGSEQWVTDAQEAQDIIARAVAKYTNKKSSLDGLTNKVMFQKAWHGSPHDHAGFDSSKIGTGEGVQAYGYGHYFSDSKDVAEWYRRNLSNDSKLTSLTDRMGLLKVGKDKLLDKYNIEADALLVDQVGDDAIDAAIEHAEDRLERWTNLAADKDYQFRDYASDKAKAWANLIPELKAGNVSYAGRGKLYEVELAPEQDEYLLWDIPLSEQSYKVKGALNNTPLAGTKLPLSQTGEQLYKSMSKGNVGWNTATDKDASKYLHSLGIRGIKYLDGSSRHEAYEVILSTKKGKYSSSKFESKGQAEQYAKAKREEGFSAKVRFNENANFNYVIFDDKDVSITAKFSRSKGWGDFPNAVIGQRSASDHKDYQAAKDGDFVAAVRLAEDTVTPGYLADIKDVVGNSNPIVVPIRSAEKTGSANAIPEAIGMQIASKLNIDFDENGIQQMERVGRTGSDGWHRIANQPSFEGDVERNRDYVIVDDTLAQGGTVAQLKEYIENNGGKVSLITALTGKQYSAKIGLSVSTLQLLRDKHGSIESWFRKSFGYGFEGLTESEARFIISAKGLSSEQVRTKIAEAKRDGADSNVQEDAKFSIAPPDESDAKFSKQDNIIPETINIDGVERPTRNSEGKLIHPTDDGLINFYKWFGDSRVVDEQGRPKVVYHGTTYDINTFDKTKTVDNGFHFGTLSQANMRASGVGKNLMPMYLSAANIQRSKDMGGNWKVKIRSAKSSGKDGIVYLNRYEGLSTEVVMRLSNDDLDGMSDADFRRKVPESQESYIVFNPSQIKSAIGNTGAFSSESDDIKFSKAEKQREPLIPESKFRKFQRFWQDDFNRFVAMKEWLADRGINLSEQADVSRAEERYHSKVANQIEDFNDFVVKPLIEKIAKAGFFMSDVADYLEAQHAEEANAVIAKLHKDPSMTAYGITNDEADDYLAKAPKELGMLANEFRNITEKTKKLLLDEGLRSKEEVDAWEAAYKHYIPVKGGDKPTKGTGKGLSVNSKTKRRLGHGRRDEAVIENILLDHERAIIEIEGNRVAKHLGMMAAEIAMPELMTIGQPVKRKALKSTVAYEVQVKGVTRAVFDSKDGANVFKQMLPATDKKIAPSEITINQTRDQRIISSASPMLAENEINMYIDGHAIRIQINDEIAARAYKHLGIEGYGHLVAAGRAINGYLSKAYTGYAPEWGISNIIRDFTAGIINLTGEEGIVMAAKAVKNYPGSLASLLRYTFTGRKKSNKWIDMYRANGGNTGAAWLPDMERLSNDVAAEYASFQGVISNLKQGDMANASRAALRKLHNVFLKWLNNLNQASENAMRLAAFRAMIESGKSVNEASHISKNITINFNKKGEFGQTANAAYLFFNASMNGQAAMNHALFKGKHKYQAWALGGAGLTALGYTMATMLGGGDEDDYDKLDDYTKERNLVIKSGDGWIKIPVPYGHGFFWSLGRSIADAQRKDELGTLPWHIASSAIEELTPLGGIVVGSDEEFKSDQVFLGLLPTVAQIAAQPALNKSIFSGGEIMPESPFYKSPADRDKMWRGTKGTIYDKVAGWLEDAGVADISPETLKHLTRSATGGAGSTVDAVISAAMLKTQGAELDANEMPFARKLYHENTIRSDRAAFQKARGEARTAAEEFRRANRDNDLVSIDRVLKDKHEMLMLDKYANKLQEFINIERDEQDAVRTNESIPIAERRLKLKELESKEAKFYDEYLNVFKIDKSVMKERLK